MALTKQDVGKIREVVKDEIVEALDKFYKLALKPIDQKLDDFKAETANNLSDVRRQIRDLNMGTPTRREFNGHEERITILEQAAGN